MDASADLVQHITSISQSIYTSDPHNPHLYLARGKLYAQLGFHDLAAADAYRALTLLEGVVEEEPDCVEYVARRRTAAITTTTTASTEDEEQDNDDDDEEEEESGFVRISRDEYDASIAPVYVLLVQSLRQCGCLRDAHEFGSRAARHLRSLDTEKSRYSDSIDLLENGLQQAQDPSTLPAQGFARRVLYPWNTHEPDRKAEETLSLLNKRLETVAPDCEVRAVALPALHQQQQDEEVSVQLGLFAKRDLQPGEIILREASLLTATNRLHDDLCDACNGPLPELQHDEAVACQECDDTIFCSQTCHDQAQAVYHAAVCGHEGLDSLGKDVADPKDKADYLYFLLLGRAIAMAATQDCHPLDLPEVKYIWGDFHDYDPARTAAASSEDASLPFSFQLSILQPMRLLEEMGLDPFATLDRYDTWVLNTLYAKFRGTASGRLSTWDGGPEVCAVHPLWCLANHSCDPNVRWEWGGEITFMVRREEEKAGWKHPKKEGRPSTTALIRKDEEILNHYCDIDLGVRQRREWAQGALGGLCQCVRCKWESSD
ncbi:hypothetical protein PISL3812_09545 [Talaromyces islandicus]|uniref:SET domain-containing protein n=1 Tax=Talaromyces islandicus TaxID=28573 RepID=A0A0U1MA03_TALIS|nr:hypothetical protein PISL3812_09545 [Talaromyces islandicus]